MRKFKTTNIDFHLLVISISILTKTECTGLVSSYHNAAALLVPVVFRGQRGRRGPAVCAGGQTGPVAQQNLGDGLMAGLHCQEEPRLATSHLLHVGVQTEGKECLHQSLVAS